MLMTSRLVLPVHLPAQLEEALGRIGRAEAGEKMAQEEADTLRERTSEVSAAFSYERAALQALVDAGGQVSQ